MKYINLLGEEIDTDQERKKHLRINPMVRVYGNGPEDKKCKHCGYFYRKYYSKTYFKCEFRGDTNGPGTDHKANWPTCGKFKESTPPIQ
jgi:hypothetical protein